MAKINVKRREYQESFKKHYKVYRSTEFLKENNTRRLILFYSVECGLKCLILKKTGKNTYEELCEYARISNKREICGHNIKAMLKELDLTFTLKSIKLNKNVGAKQIAPKEYNQLWRYGIQTKNERDEQQVEEVLNKIAEMIRTKI